MIDGTRLAIALWLVLGAVEARGQTEPKAPPSLPPPTEVVRWIEHAATPVGAVDAPPDAAEAAALQRLVKGARVIALGEPGHGAREPLAYRNRLIRFLVLHDGLTAVALESGLAEMRRVDAYIQGGPGDAATIAHDNLTHGFGEASDNVELIRWLRTYDADPAHRPVHLYGIDLSTIQTFGQGAAGYGVVLGDVLAYLERTIPEASRPVRRRLEPFRARFTEVDYPKYSEQERADLNAALRALQTLFSDRRSVMIARSARRDYDWAAREAYDARQLPDLFAVWTLDPFHDIPTLMKEVELRDRAMAGHLLWALRQEGGNGKILLFQADGHVAAAPLVGSLMRVFPSQPDVTGVILRRRLGHAYRVIGSVSSQGNTADDSAIGSVDRAFVAAGQTRSLLDLRGTPRNGWWGLPQSFLQAGARVDDATPNQAFDALLFFDRLTPEPRVPAP